jgi:DNA repair protein RadC
MASPAYTCSPASRRTLNRRAALLKPKPPREIVHLVRENLRLLAELSTRYEVGDVAVTRREKTVDSPESVAAYLKVEMANLEQEQLRVVMLDVRNHLLGVALVYQGSVNQAVVSLADVFREPIRAGASAIILAHNHPSGDPAPSPEDVRVTAQAGEVGALLEIEVLDHLVIGRPDYFSLRENGLYQPPPCGRSHRRERPAVVTGGPSRARRTSSKR